jgi:hypothetical protein
MLKRIRESLTLKWMIFSVLLATIPLAIAGFSIIQIYQDSLKKSVITIEKEKADKIVQRTTSFFERVTSGLLIVANDEHLITGEIISRSKHLENLLYQKMCFDCP